MSQGDRLHAPLFSAAPTSEARDLKVNAAALAPAGLPVNEQSPSVLPTGFSGEDAGPRTDTCVRPRPPPGSRPPNQRCPVPPGHPDPGRGCGAGLQSASPCANPKEARKAISPSPPPASPSRHRGPWTGSHPSAPIIRKGGTQFSKQKKHKTDCKRRLHNTVRDGRTVGRTDGGRLEEGTW